jgi:hypothetical protein
VAVAVHGGSRSGVAALALHGPPEGLLTRDGTPRQEPLAALRLAAMSVMHALEPAR